MKSKKLIRGQSLKAFAAFVTALFGVATLPAATITLTNSDASGTSSFVLAGNWSDGNAPASGNTYQVVTNFTLRTPQGYPGNYQFAGDSLLLSGGADLKFKAANGEMITVNSLSLNGGIVDNGNGATTNYLDGSLTLGAGGGVFDNGGSDRGIIVDAPIAGSGPLTVIGAGRVVLTATNSNTGSTTVRDGVLDLASTGSLLAGTGVAVIGSGSTLNAYPLANGRRGVLQLEGLGDVLGSQTVTLNNGTLVYFPAAGAGTGVVQNVTLSSGWNDLNAATNGAAGSLLTIGNLTRNAGASANFRSQGGVLGAGGNNGSIVVTNLNGVSLANINGILGGWAYAADNGANPISFARKQASGSGIEVAPTDYTVTSGTTLASAGATANALANDSVNADQTLTANKTINSLISERDVLINNNAILTLASGGVIMRANTHWIKRGSGTGPSYLTSGFSNGSGTNEFFVNVQAGLGNMKFENVVVTNNGATPVSFIKNGTGPLILHSQQAYTGLTVVNAGTLQLQQNDNILTKSSGIIINPGGTISVEQNNSLTGYSSSGGNPVTVNAGGTLTTGSGITLHVNGPLALLGGTLASSTPNATYGSWDLNQDITAGGNLVGSTISATDARLDRNGGGNVTFTVASGAAYGGVDLNVSGTLNSSSGLTKAGAGIMALANTNAYTGGTIVNGGTLRVTGGGWGSPAVRNAMTVNYGATLVTAVGDALGGASAKVNPLTINGGTLTHTPNGNLTFNSVTITNSGGVIQSIGGSSSFLDFYGGGSSLTIPATETNTAFLRGLVRLRQNNTTFLVQDGSAAIDLQVDAALSWTGEGNGALIKTGAGTMLLTAINTYTGGTTVNQGTLALGANAALASANIVVASNSVLDVSALSGGLVLGSQTLQVNGTVAGSLNDGASVLVPGSAPYTAGTLTVTGNLTLNGSGAVNFDIGSTNTTGNDLIAVNGNLTLNGTTPINFNFLNGSPAVGVPYLVVTNSGMRSGGAGYLSVGTMGYIATFDDSNPHAIYVTFTGFPATLTWQGDNGANQWDMTTWNWLDTNNATALFLPGDNVIFSNNTVNTTVDIAIAAAPGSIRVTGTNNFNFIGAGSLTGGGSLVKNGSGLLSLGTTNDFTGPVKVTGGTLILGNSYALGLAASVTISNGGQADFNGMNASGRAYNFILAGTNAGTGGILLNSGSPIYNNPLVGDVTLLADATVGGGVNRFDIGTTAGTKVLSANNHVLTKVGPEDVALRTQTTNLAGLVVSGGRIWGENNDNNLGTNITVKAGAGVGTYGARSQNASVTLNGGRILNIGGGAGTWTGPVTLTANSALDPGGNIINLTAPVGGNFSLTQISGGATITVASNTYAGGTVVSNGTFQIGNNSTVGSVLGPIAAYGNGTATFFRSDAQVITNPITGSGNLYYIGTNTIELQSVSIGGTLGLGGNLGGSTFVSATLMLNPGNALTVGALQLSAANVSPAMVIQSGSLLTATNWIKVGAWGYETSVYNLNGGQLEVTNVGASGIILGETGNGVWNINGGLAEVNGIILNVGSDAYGGGHDVLNLTNGVLRIGAGGISSGSLPLTASYINLAGGTLGAFADWASTNAMSLSGTPVVDSGTNNIVLSGVLSGGGSLVKQGLGSLTLAGANSYSGQTTVSNGTLNLAGSLAVGAGPFLVAPSGTLKGTGSTFATITVNGTVAPGASVGTLTVGNAVWNGGGTYAFELSSATSSAGWDLLNAVGTVNVQATAGSKFTIKLVSLADASTPGSVPDFDPAANYSWTIATAGGGVLNFDPAKFAVDASAFANAYAGTFGVTSVGNSIVVQYIAPVTTPPSITGQAKLLDGTFSLTFSGTAGAGYSVRASTNVALVPVVNWPVIGTGTFGASPVTFIDVNATNYPQRYYLISVP